MPVYRSVFDCKIDLYRDCIDDFNRLEDPVTPLTGDIKLGICFSKIERKRQVLGIECFSVGPGKTIFEPNRNRPEFVTVLESFC